MLGQLGRAMSMELEVGGDCDPGLGVREGDQREERDDTGTT